MADIRICPNCGARNPSSNRFCEDCGYDMNKSPVSSVPTAPLFCPNGHMVSNASLGFCDVCGEKLTTVMPSFSAHGKICPSCGALTPEDGIFCVECGTSLNIAPAVPIPTPVAPIPTPMPEPMPAPIIHSAPVRRELPDIPDIMHTMTNNDMKK